MDVVVISGGLGNQMSQYAFYLAKKRKDKNCIVIFNPYSQKEHNGSELESVFNIQYRKGLINKILSWIYGVYDGIPKVRSYLERIRITSIREPRNYDYLPIFLEPDKRKGIRFLIGGWHSEHYYSAIRSEIRNLYAFSIEKSETDVKKIESIILSDENSVSIHVRRGDYIGHPDFDGVANDDYYLKSIEYLTKKIGTPHFYVFSNSIEYCERFFSKLDINYTLVEFGGKRSYLDMYLMSLCRHHIIANSTFSWWGAWLSSYEKSITIRPSNFLSHTLTKDLYPANWISLN